MQILLVPTPLAVLEPDARPASWLDAACAAAAWLLPLGVGIGAAATGPRWQDDLAVVRDLGLLPAGSEGALSTVLSQLFALLPLASRCERAALLGVLALGACSALGFRLTCELLNARRPMRINPLLALLGTQLWALSPLVARDAAGPGSAALPLLLILLGVKLLRSAAADARCVPLAGVLLGLTWGESHAAALALTAVLLAEWLPQRSPLPELPWLRFAAGFVLAAGLCLLLPWWRGNAPGLWLDLGLGALPVLAESAPQSSAWLGWGESLRQCLSPVLERLGLVPLLLVAAGVCAAATPRAQRRELVPWAVLVATGALGAAGLARTPETQALCALLESAGLAAFAPLGLQTALHWLWWQRVPLAKPASVLGCSFALTLVLQRLESSAADVLPVRATEAWTEEALARLPSRSVALVQSPALGLRLLAAQVLHGARPDVTVVPLGWLHRGSVLSSLLSRSPELAPVLRQLAVNGYPDEYSMSRLADVRPLFVELDPRWNARLLEHLRPDALWLGYSAHALAKSERSGGAERSRAALRRLIDDPELGAELDESTRLVLVRQARQQALTWAALGEDEPAAEALHWLERIQPRDPWAKELALRIDQTSGRVAVNDLVAGTRTGSP
jgi:hypothetical protein